MCEHDLVKVVVRGHVGVHGGLSRCGRPQEQSSVFVIHDQLLPRIECLSAPLDRRGSDDEFDDTNEDLYYLQKCQASKTPLFIPIQSYSLAPALF